MRPEISVLNQLKTFLESHFEAQKQQFFSLREAVVSHLGNVKNPTHRDTFISITWNEIENGDIDSKACLAQINKYIA